MTSAHVGGRSVKADPKVINDAADEVMDIRDDLLEAAKPTRRSTRRAADGVEGWQTEEQLKETARLWEKQTHALAENMGNTSMNLRQSSRNYQTVEAVNSAGMRREDNPWG